MLDATVAVGNWLTASVWTISERARQAPAESFRVLAESFRVLAESFQVLAQLFQALAQLFRVLAQLFRVLAQPAMTSARAAVGRSIRSVVERNEVAGGSLQIPVADTRTFPSTAKNGCIQYSDVTHSAGGHSTPASSGGSCVGFTG
jgi:hypothetical protein